MTGRQFFGVLFFALGALIMAMTGGCALAVGLSNFRFSRPFDSLFGFFFGIAISAIPCAIGFFIARAGLRMGAGTTAASVGPQPKEEVVPSSKDDVEKMNKEIE